MSSSNKSRKEQEVIAQQRKLAAKLALSKKSGNDIVAAASSNSSASAVTSKSSSGSSVIRPRTASSALLSMNSKLPAAATSTARKTSPKSSSQKANDDAASKTRPAIKRPGLKRPTQSSASAVLAAARAKVAGKKESEGSGIEDHDDADTPKDQRKMRSDTNRLASLVKNVASSAPLKSDDHTLSTAAFASNITPDDFWKNIRDWDFVCDLANMTVGKDETALTMKKPIPETFISVRHYISLWAPLCLAETRAQLISELMTSSNSMGGSKASLFTQVELETTWKGGGRTKDRNLHADLIHMDACSVQIKTLERNRGAGPYFPNDVFCLVPTECRDTFEMLLNGKQVTNSDESAFRKFCIVGHTEVQRKELNGLILKVSKRKWAQIGTSSMFLMKIGANITALREFTALCNVETIPLKRYLLGHHLNDGKARKETSGALVPASRDAPVQKEKLLKQMGGVQALGKGFTEYAQQKFNHSQLVAISASSTGYGEGGITLIKGPPGTGKTTTLTAILNSLHIRQYNKYYEEVRRIAAMKTGSRQGALDAARKAKPRLLVCAPSNAAIDNIILKIMEDGFKDGSGHRYNPSMIRVGVGQSAAVGSISLETKINEILADVDMGQVESAIAGYRMEMQRLSSDIASLRRRCHAMVDASPWPLGRHWEIRIDEKSFEKTGKCFFVNHKEQTTTYECPPPPEPGEDQFSATAMPEYRVYMQRIVKAVESYFSIKSNLERNVIIKGSMDTGANNFMMKQSLENHVLNTVHMVMTTLGTAGNRVFEGTDRFEVVVVDEAAQSTETATLSALQLGSRHCVLVGDPQQLPATIFNVSGRNSKYDRSLFQRLEEAGHPVHMLNEQYRMHPKISHFPRHIFYGGNLLDGPNVIKPGYGNPLLKTIQIRVPAFQPLTVLDLDSREERGGTSLSNSTEADLAIHLYNSLKVITNGLSTHSKVAIITPYSQQSNLLKRKFRNALGSGFMQFVEINTVDAFQGREANIVIFSAVRAAGSHGIGFLSDVRRMNVALTRAKHFLFILARCKSIQVNPYWRDLVEHARESNAVLQVPIISGGNIPQFGGWQMETAVSAPPPPPPPPPPASDPRKRKPTPQLNSNLPKPPADPRKRARGN